MTEDASLTPLDGPPGPDRSGRRGGRRGAAWRTARLLRAIQRRRAFLGATLAVLLVSGLAATFLSPSRYEASTTVIPLHHDLIIYDWLTSRQAAALVVAQVGDRLVDALLEDGRAPVSAAASAAAAVLQEETDVRILLHEEDARPRFVVSIRMWDAGLAREVVQAYVDSLSALRPRLDGIVRAEVFTDFYDGGSEADALARAETAARQREYWMVFDEPTAARVSLVPSHAFGVGVTVVGSLLVVVLLGLLLEWVSEVRKAYAEDSVEERPARGVGAAARDVQVLTLANGASGTVVPRGGGSVPQFELRVTVVQPRQAESS